jgi:hypothetical protein
MHARRPLLDKLRLVNLRALTLAASLLACLPLLGQSQTAETIFFNGDILTGAHLSAADRSHTPPRVSSLAVNSSGRILFIGDDESVLRLKTPTTRLVDLHGAFATPGFDDAHTHMASAGLQRLEVDLDNVPSLAAMQQKIKTYAANLPPGQWILGGGWDHTKWKSGKLPSARDLDTVSAGRPLYLERTDGHIAVLNTAALAACGITASTPAPLGGAIDIDPATHQPTGIVRDAALTLVRPRIPPPDAATRRRALQLAMQDALQHGVTSVQDFSDYEDFQALAAIEADDPRHELPVRFAEWMPFDLSLAQLTAYRNSHLASDPFLHTTMLKGFMDGSLGSRTAALAAPYSDDPGNSGLPRYTQSRLNAMTVERALAGYQIGFHAIGDRANTMALDAYAAGKAALKAAYEKRFPAGRPHTPFEQVDSTRWRIEHAQVLLPGDFSRFADMRIIASMQPSHLLTDMAWAGDRLGPERTPYAYAWRSMLDHHITLAFGTDYPVESISPFRGLYSAITRQNEAGTQTFHPEQKLTLNEALYAYTQASAFAENAENDKGELVPGRFADFILLDRDITKATPREILNTRVLQTFVGGHSRYNAASTHAALPSMLPARPDGD